MKILKTVIILLFVVSYARADVIFSPDANKSIAFSIEGIGSYEFPFSNHLTLNCWGGFGLVSPINHFFDPSFGGEIATELRYYFLEKYKGLNIGLYGGFAFMKQAVFVDSRHFREDNLTGFVPGLKITNKRRINSWLVSETYISLSIPRYLERSKEAPEWVRLPEDPSFILTIGLRIGFNKVHGR